MLNKTTGKLTAKAMTYFLALSIVNALYLGTLLILLDISEKSLETQRKARLATLSVALFSADIQNFTAKCLDSICFKGVKDRIEIARAFPQAKQAFSILQMELNEYPEDGPLLAKMGATLEATVTYTRALAAIKLLRFGSPDKHFFNEYCFKVIEGSKELGADLVLLEEKYRDLEKSSPTSFLTNDKASLWTFFLVMAGGTLSIVASSRIWSGLFHDISKRLADIERSMVQIAAGKFNREGSPIGKAGSDHDEIDSLGESLIEAALRVELARSVETLIIEAAGNFICLLDQRMTIREISQRNALMIGRNSDDLIGKRFPSLLPMEEVETFNQNTAAAKTNFPCSIICGDGSISTFNLSAARTMEGSYAISGFDITKERLTELQLRASENRYRRMVDAVPVAVLTTDAAMHITSANTYTEELTGRGVDKLLGINYLDIFSGDSQMVLRPDGQKSFAEVIKAPYQSEQSGYLLCLNDITAQMEVEMAKRDFVNMIGHDIRSPLMAVYGTTTLLVDGHDQESRHLGRLQPAQLAGLKEAGDILFALIRLLNDFLATGKIVSGQTFLNLKSVSVEEIAHDLYECLSQCGISAGIFTDEAQAEGGAATAQTVKIHYQPGEREIESIDIEYLRNTLLDLILLLASETNSKELKVSLYLTDGLFKINLLAREEVSTRLNQALEGLKDNSLTFFPAVSPLPGKPLSGLSLSLAVAVINSHGGNLALQTKGNEQGFLISL